MKKAVFLCAIILTACGGTLTDEQRKKIKEEMEVSKIVKITDAEITGFALDQGRKIFDALESKKFNSQKTDSIAAAHHASIRFLVPGSKNARALEQQLIEAYITELVNGNLQENIQKIYKTTSDYDSLLYSKPVVTPMPNGVENLEGIWNIYLSRKEVILAATRKH